MIKHTIAIALFAGLMVGAPASTAHGDAPVDITAGPAAFIAGYATRVVAIEAGQALNFDNLDLVGHNVRSVATKPCEAGQCPLFSVPLGVGSDLAIDGVEELAPGTYEFFCQPHPATMRGFLVVA